MAGDHKCPVCQATFTRPQHVARHMRSHTGDRPYKCRLCGDQFARSDLLSRHVNKCHAGDKPPTTTTPARRKGHHGLSSTRATTSKQACDQCVINTLPCDGAFPCSKCSARKTPCTFVKFQRQTAPSGPGHKNSNANASTNLDASTSSHSNAGANPFLAASVPRPDELFLGPPPLTVPSMAGDLFYPPQQHPQFAFPHQQQQAWDAQSNHHHARSLSLSSSSATDSGQDAAPDVVAARLRHAELLRAGLLPGYYGSTQPNADQWAAAGQFGSPAYTAAQLSRREKGMSDSFAQYLPPGSTNNSNSSGYGMDAGFNGGGLYSLHSAHNHHNNHHPRRGSVDAFSDAELDGLDGDAHSEPSQCGSASSSNVHLPLVDFDPHNPHQLHDQQRGGHEHMAHYALGDFDGSREGRFATSFGDLSLSDSVAAGGVPNFLEGNPEGNAPFFTGPAMKSSPQDSTPRPVRDLMAAAHAMQQSQSQQQHANGDTNDPSTGDRDNPGQSQAQNARDREAEMRELRDFWKAYLRTPLTGPSSGFGQTPKAELLNSGFGGSGILDALDTSSLVTPGIGAGGTLGGARPGVKRGLSRVASLPSVRTPPEEKAGLGLGGVFQVPRMPASQSRDVPMQTPGGRNSRTEDDLKRYEQAVLARQHEAPLKLSIQPKARRGAKREGSQAGSVSPSVRPAGVGPSMQPQHGGMQSMVPQAYDGNGMQGMFVEPGPLDNPALSGLGHQHGGAGSGGEGVGGTSSDEAPPTMARAFPNLSHSRSTTTTNANSHSDGAQRPSFKRLPSQTLENTVQKRAARGGWGDEEDGADEEEVEAVGPISVGVHHASKNGMMPPPPPSAYTENAMERYRRQSAPTGVRPGVEGVAGGVGGKEGA
ncbi:hypothetical protein SCHPADRAFT_915375 [Schizopora paradoxa]|uniref:Zn(2)-C6 fungal-type domain-containing protein n=1 Tax=Schizopora paradoxa TaxID=27342 RepID=A0A0H2RM43_9AGAM|nr:hypothetical protein SCHPADRAFT_915375 [Schizopora paradoxa]